MDALRCIENVIEKSGLYIFKRDTLLARFGVYLDHVVLETDYEIDAIFILIVHRAVTRVPF